MVLQMPGDFPCGKPGVRLPRRWTPRQDGRADTERELHPGGRLYGRTRPAGLAVVLEVPGTLDGLEIWLGVPRKGYASAGRQRKLRSRRYDRLSSAKGLARADGL